MVHKDAAGAVVFEVGDLQAVGVPDLLGLEGRVDAIDLDYRFGLLRLRQRRSTGRQLSIGDEARRLTKPALQVRQRRGALITRCSFLDVMKDRHRSVRAPRDHALAGY